jgi:hypothetical protein
VVTRSVETDHQAIADQLVVTYAGEIGQILNALRLGAQTEQQDRQEQKRSGQRRATQLE